MVLSREEQEESAAAEPSPTPPTAYDAEVAVVGFGTFASLRLRNFRLLLFGTTLANAAEWVQQVSLSWLVYDWTGSGAALGTLNLVRSGATLALTPVAGVTIDRAPKKLAMMAVAAYLVVISLIIAAVLFAGYEKLWVLLVFAIMGGMAGAFDLPLRQTVVFHLVPRYMVTNAVGLVQTGWGLMRSVGPAIGGFMIVWVGAGGNFLIEAVVYSIIFLNTMRIVFPPSAPLGPRPPFFANLREGFAYAIGAKLTRTFLLMGMVLPMFIIPSFVAMPPIFAKEVFSGGADTMGLLLSSVGVGGIFGGLVSASLGGVDRRGLIIIVSLLLTALSLVAFALAPSVPLAMIAFAFAGFFEMIFLTGNQTLLQLSIPDHLRGRVTSVTSQTMLLSPLGAVVAGLGADYVGARETMIVMSLIAAGIAVLTFIFVPTIRDYRTSEAMRSIAGA